MFKRAATHLFMTNHAQQGAPADGLAAAELAALVLQIYER